MGDLGRNAPTEFVAEQSDGSPQLLTETDEIEGR